MTRKRLIYSLLIIALASGFYTLRHHSQAQSTATGVPRSQAAQSEATPQSHSDAGLQRLVTQWASGQDSKAAVVVKELTGGRRTASYNQAASLVPASTYKIYVAYAVLHAIEQHTFSLQTTLDDGNSIESDLDGMILDSNNDDARALGFFLGWKNINTLLRTQDIGSTNLYNYVPPSTQPVGDKHTTAADLAAILTKLYAGKLLNTTDTQLLLGLMGRQVYRERIPAGVPSDITVADKPGWLTVAEGDGENIQNDAAIVYGPKSTYILVIMTDGTSTRPLANLSQQIYAYLQT